MERFSGLELKAVSINTVAQFTLRILTSIPTLIATLLIAYFAGYETLGSFTKIVAFVSLFYLIVDLGMNSVFLREYFERVNKYFGNLIVLRLLFSIALIPLIVVLTNLLPENKVAHTGFSGFEKYGIILFSLTVITTGLTISLQALLQKKLSYSVSLLPSLLSSAVLIIFIVTASFKHDLYLMLFSYVLSGATLVGLLFIVIKRKYNLKFTLTKDFSKFSKALFIASLPMGAMLFFNLVYAKADTFILSIFRPTVDVGVYGISYKFFEVFLAVPAYMSNSVYPLLLRNKHTRNYSSLFKRYTSLFLFSSILISVIVFFGAPLITVLKPDFIMSVGPLQILSLSLPFFFLTSLLQWHFLIRKKLSFLVPLYGGALALNVILNLIFVPNYSYYAAAITTCVSEALVFVAMLWYLKRIKIA